RRAVFSFPTLRSSDLVRSLDPEAAMSETATMQLPLFDLRDRRVLVLGLGGSGAAMARWAPRQGATLRLADSRAEPPGLASLRARERKSTRLNSSHVKS